MSDQDDFLNALGVTVDGVPVDREGQEAAAALAAAARMPNPPGTNNYYFPPTMPVMNPDTMRPREAALQQATFDGRAVNDFRNTGRRDSATDENSARDPNHELDEEDLDEEERWRRDQNPHTLLMGEEELEDYEDESDATSIADSWEGFSDPERILCQSDQCWPRKGYLFLVKWRECSVLRSSWEWEEDFEDDLLSGRPQFFSFLKLPHPIRVEWEERKERIARGKEKKFDVAKWQFDVREETTIRSQMRVLRRWKRKLEGIQRVLEAQRRDEEEDFAEDAIRRSEKEDREDKIREAAEMRKAEQERKRAREDENTDMEDVTVKRTA